MSGMASGQTEPCTSGSASLFAVSEWAYAGVNHSLAGNGGPECAQFISIRRRLWETVLAVLWTAALALWSWRRLQVPPAPKVVREDRGGKRCLLVLLCLVFGMELGFKFASRTVIYILNPCHIITMLQIVMLAAPPTSCLLTVLFRVHIHWLNGPLLALLFPVLNTRMLPLEREVYWVQHGLMLAVPCYLMRLGGVFSTEPLADLSWGLLSLALQYLYHFLVLQALALVRLANIQVNPSLEFSAWTSSQKCSELMYLPKCNWKIGQERTYRCLALPGKPFIELYLMAHASFAPGPP
ncbi:hypothetical protein HPB49_004772 [Dermacentor silvarum]|uniref:Uncharacterized protein n=1 Tax=Dermacentor silvarum TaxID=543639 RepID=A0ACB8DB85_DERSI|nr:hypothetical protein HPB49_004772 [Dermacentor silvarum]